MTSESVGIAAVIRDRLDPQLIGGSGERTEGMAVAPVRGRRYALFGHERLDVYGLALDYAAWVRGTLLGACETPKQKDQLSRASESIVLNVAEGNAKALAPDRRRFFEIARGSAAECAAVQDLLHRYGRISDQQRNQGWSQLDRISRMLTALGKRGYATDRNTP